MAVQFCAGLWAYLQTLYVLSWEAKLLENVHKRDEESFFSSSFSELSSGKQDFVLR